MSSFFFLVPLSRPVHKEYTVCFPLYSVSPGGVYGIFFKNLLSLPIQYSTLFLVLDSGLLFSYTKYFSRRTLSSIQMQENVYRATKYGVLLIPINSWSDFFFVPCVRR